MILVPSRFRLLGLSASDFRLLHKKGHIGQKTFNIGLYVTAPKCLQKSQLPQNTKCLTPVGILRVVVALVGRGL